MFKIAYEMLQNTYKKVNRVVVEATVQELTDAVGSCSLFYGLNVVLL